MTVPWLHILTSDAIIARPDFVATAILFLRTVGARGALHLRTRQLSGTAYCQLATHLLRESRASGALLVINDRVDIALAVGAEAVQLGRASLRPLDVKGIAPRLRIGVSIHSPAEACTATSASWLLAGHVFETESHPNIPGRGVGFLRDVVAHATVSVIAVGGIKPERLASLQETGAAGIAVSSGLWNERTPKDAVSRYLSSYGNGFG